METVKVILIQTIVLVLGLLLYYLLKNFWPKYFEAKATNQATKEDIGEITEIVESIKTELVKSTEELKADLSLSNQHKLNFKSAERDAIFDFHKKLSAWLYYLVRLTPSSFNFDNYKDAKKEEAEFSKRQYECDIAEAHVTLFMHDQKFLDIKKNLTVNIINYERELSKTLSEIYYQHSKIELEILIAQPNQIPALRGSIYPILKPLLEKYREESLKQYKVIHDYHVQFRLLINERLKALNEQL